MHECVHKKMCNGFYFMLGIIEMEKQTNKHMLNDSKVYSVVKYIYMWKYFKICFLGCM